MPTPPPPQRWSPRTRPPRRLYPLQTRLMPKAVSPKKSALKRSTAKKPHLESASSRSPDATAAPDADPLVDERRYRLSMTRGALELATTRTQWSNNENTPETFENDFRCARLNLTRVTLQFLAHIELLALVRRAHGTRSTRTSDAITHYSLPLQVPRPRRRRRAVQLLSALPERHVRRRRPLASVRLPAP